MRVQRAVVRLRRGRGPDRPRSPTACTHRPGVARARCSTSLARAWTGDADDVDAASGRRSTRSGCQVWATTTSARCVIAVLDARCWLRRSWEGARRRPPSWPGSIKCALTPTLMIGAAAAPSQALIARMRWYTRPPHGCCLRPEHRSSWSREGAPADDGKKLIQEMVRFADDPRSGTASFSCRTTTSGWAQPVYPGCDVWLNNPLRSTRSASGTRA